MHYSFLRALILGFFIGFIPINIYNDLKLNNLQFISVLTCYTVMGFVSSRYLTKYLNYKFVSEICLVILLIIYISKFHSSYYFYDIFRYFLILAQLVNKLSSSSNLRVMLNYAETLYLFLISHFYLSGGSLYTIGTIQCLDVCLFWLLIFYILNNNTLFSGESNMKIKTEFKGNNIPYEYTAGADVSDSINGNTIKSFPFEVN